jgi:hypothetical protein
LENRTTLCEEFTEDFQCWKCGAKWMAHFIKMKVQTAYDRSTRYPIILALDYHSEQGTTYPQPGAESRQTVVRQNVRRFRLFCISMERN